MFWAEISADLEIMLIEEIFIKALLRNKVGETGAMWDTFCFSAAKFV